MALLSTADGEYHRWFKGFRALAVLSENPNSVLGAHPGSHSHPLLSKGPYIRFWPSWVPAHMAFTHIYINRNNTNKSFKRLYNILGYLFQIALHPGNHFLSIYRALPNLYFLEWIAFHVWMLHNLFYQLLVVGQLGCFQQFAIINNPSVNNLLPMLLALFHPHICGNESSS